jgi:hypothetical protein
MSGNHQLEQDVKKLVPQGLAIGFQFPPPLYMEIWKLEVL